MFTTVIQITFYNGQTVKITTQTQSRLGSQTAAINSIIQNGLITDGTYYYNVNSIFTYQVLSLDQSS